MTLHIDNMTGPQNIHFVRAVLDELEIEVEHAIRLGEVVLKPDTAPEKIQRLQQRLEEVDMHVISSRKEILSEKVKQVILRMVAANAIPQENYSVYISRQLNHSYTYLANIFSETQDITIEHFLIRQRIRRAAEILAEGKLSIGQVADKLHYSSVGHFSGQFKKITGVSPLQYKKQLEEDLRSN